MNNRSVDCVLVWLSVEERGCHVCKSALEFEVEVKG